MSQRKLNQRLPDNQALVGLQAKRRIPRKLLQPKQHLLRAEKDNLLQKRLLLNTRVTCQQLLVELKTL
jgi:hypothetical protein